jgi:hypothetical protein
VLPKVYVNAEEVTADVLAKISEETKITLGSLFAEGKLVQTPVAVMPNSNNRGYCRALLDEASLAHFVKYLSAEHISAYDRTYLWKILYDQVRLLSFSPLNYIKTILAHLASETVEEILRYILMKAVHIFKCNLGNIEAAVSAALQTEVRSVIAQKIYQNKDNASMRNLLVDFLIAFADVANEEIAAELLQMVKHDALPNCGDEKVVNKA